MAITILPPPPPPQDYDDSDSSADESDDGGVALDNDGDLDMRPKKRARTGESKSVVTPGEVVTDDPQWMRYVAITLLPVFALYALHHNLGHYENSKVREQ